MAGFQLWERRVTKRSRKREGVAVLLARLREIAAARSSEEVDVSELQEYKRAVGEN
jgi:hypothetical protein